MCYVINDAKQQHDHLNESSTKGVSVNIVNLIELQLHYKRKSEILIPNLAVNTDCNNNFAAIYSRPVSRMNTVKHEHILSEVNGPSLQPVSQNMSVANSQQELTTLVHARVLRRL